MTNLKTRIMAAGLAFMLLFGSVPVYAAGFFGPGKDKEEGTETDRNAPLSDEEMIAGAMKILALTWAVSVESAPGYEDVPLTVKVVNTRLIRLKEDLTASGEKGMEMFGNRLYLVKFELLSNYFGPDQYLSNIGRYDMVSVDKNGHMKAEERDLFELYRNRYYIYDYSDIIAEVVDYGSAYNGYLLGGETESASEEAGSTLYDQAIKAAGRIEERRDLFGHTILSGPDYEDVLRNMQAVDYDQPSHVYELSVNMNELVALFAEELNASPEEIPKELQKKFDKQVFSLIISYALTLSASRDAQSVALYNLVNMIVSETTSFRMAELDHVTACLLTYESSYPVMIVFDPGQEGTAMVNVQLLLVEDFPDNEEEAEKALNEILQGQFSVTLTEIR